MILDFATPCRSLGRMKQRCLRLLLVIHLCVSTAVAAADNVLTVHAAETSILVSPLDSSQQHVNLPALDVTVIARFSCSADVAAESITVSIADTHVHFNAAEIADATSINASLHLPADQIAPISTHDFCRRDVASEIKQLLIPGVASAQVSLRCGSEDQSSIRFASIALPVRLHCESDESQVPSWDK